MKEVVNKKHIPCKYIGYFQANTNTYGDIEILREKYEQHHNVSITDDALKSSIELSSRYINDRFLPDKAIDLIDEACATIKVQMESVPVKLDYLTREIMKLQIENESLKKEKDELSQKRKEEIKSIKKKPTTRHFAWSSGDFAVC